MRIITILLTGRTRVFQGATWKGDDGLFNQLKNYDEGIANQINERIDFTSEGLSILSDVEAFIHVGRL